jgi:hypothetical protein
VKHALTDAEIIREAMRILGSKTSLAKAKAAQKNGRLGGRPKKE